MKQVWLVLATLLAAFSIAAPAFAQDTVTCDQNYTVASGDWLSKLANPLAYPAIVTQTNLKSETEVSYATIGNADVLEVGWKLCIPSADTAKGLNGDNAPAALDRTALANATYSSDLVDGGKVTLKDGNLVITLASNAETMRFTK